MLEYIFVAIFGAIIGSFLNVVILREESGETLTGRSHCPQCKKTLVWYELIPILSYLIQRGKCRSCGTPLSIQYPLVELATATMFVVVLYRLGGVDVVSTSYKLQATSFSTFYFLLSTLPHFAVWSVLVVIFIYDLKTKLIPDKFSLTFALLALLTVVASFAPTSYKLQATSFETLAWHLLAGLLLFLPFYALWKYSDGRWMGLGDGKLVVGIGFLLGITDGFSAVMLAFWIGAAVMLTVIAVQRALARFSYKLQAIMSADRSSCGRTSYKLGLKSEIPFGPFLILGCAVVYFCHFSPLFLLW